MAKSPARPLAVVGAALLFVTACSVFLRARNHVEHSVNDMHELQSGECPVLPHRRKIPRPSELDFAFKFNETARQAYATNSHVIATGSGVELDPHIMAGFLASVQRENKIHGSVGEIGVHHGKFFTSIAMTAKNGEGIFACDLFDKQDLNVDGSGLGDFGMFIKNINHFGIKKEDVTLFTDSSLDLSYDFPASHKLSPFRFFSVDGGHTKEITFSDMQWVACNLADGGIVVVDDITNFYWPGVFEGVVTYFMSGPVPLLPFLLGHNKLYLTTPAFHDVYYDSILRHEVLGKFVTPFNPHSRKESTPYILNGNKVLLASAMTGDVVSFWKRLLSGA